MGRVDPAARLRQYRAVRYAMMGDVDLSVEDLLAAPVGVALLDRIESAHRDEFVPFNALHDSDPDAVQRGVELVERMSFGELLHEALYAADYIAGPWQPGAATSLAFAYELALARRPIGEMICQRFSSHFVESIHLASQERWVSNHPEADDAAQPAFTDFSRVYGTGEFSWDGFWTVTDPPAEIHDDLVDAWEMYQGPITRWSLPVRPEVRLWTIDHPSDWARLVETYPRVASSTHSGWELPGPNQHIEDTGRLSSVPGQHAVRTAVSRHILPDWEAVSRDYQAVHLSWAGFLTTEGFVSDLVDGGATMLRYWRSERTHWLKDVFGDPQPLRGPVLSGAINETVGLDVSSGNEARKARDAAELFTILGR